MSVHVGIGIASVRAERALVQHLSPVVCLMLSVSDGALELLPTVAASVHRLIGVMDPFVTYQGQLVGRFLATEIARNRIGAQAAHQMGLVGDLVPEPSLAVVALALQTGSSFRRVRKPVILQPPLVGESFGTDIAHPVRYGAMYGLLVRAQVGRCSEPGGMKSERFL